MTPVVRDNIVLLMADQHQASRSRCYGDSAVMTPAIDRLASEGVRFDRAYCNAPLCMPARASLLTEKLVSSHRIDSNRGQVPAGITNFVRALSEAGYFTAEIGKMHFWEHGGPYSHVNQRRDYMESLGFRYSDELVGKVASLVVRDSYSDYLQSLELLDDYHRSVRASIPRDRSNPDMLFGTHYLSATPVPFAGRHHVDRWLGRKVAEWIDNYSDRQPFLLWVGWPGPHSPYDAPKADVEEYADADVRLGSIMRPSVPDSQSGSSEKRRPIFITSDPAFVSSTAIRRAIRAYLADISIIDEAISLVIETLSRNQMMDRTWIIYTSDHGEMLGSHGLFGKQVFYEESVRVPLIIRPPGRLGSALRNINSPHLAEHVDLAATIRQIAHVESDPTGHGHALFNDEHLPIAVREAVRSENLGLVMVSNGRHKVVADADTGELLQVFDLKVDPCENYNIASSASVLDDVSGLITEHLKPYIASRHNDD